MSNNIVKSILKKLITDELAAKKISSDESVALNSFVDGLTDKNYYEVGYTEFNKSLSAGLTFKDSERVAIFSTGANPLKVGDVKEEKQFDLVLNTIDASFGTITDFSLFNSNETVEYLLNTDYTIDLSTGIVTRVLTGNILAGQVVTLIYVSDEAKTSGTAVLQTNSISLPSSTIKAIMVDADDKNISLELSKNNLDFYTINDYNISEEVESTDEVYLRVITASPNSIRKILIIFDKNLS